MINLGVKRAVRTDATVPTIDVSTPPNTLPNPTALFSGVYDWFGGVTIQPKEVRLRVNCLLRSNQPSPFVTNTIFSNEEARNWDLIGQVDMVDWVPSLYYFLGEQVRIGGIRSERNVAGVSRSQLDELETACWDRDTDTVRIRNVNTDTTILETDDLIVVDTTRSDVTITFPMQLTIGKRVVIHKLSRQNSLHLVSDPVNLILNDNSVLGTQIITNQYANYPYVHIGKYWGIFA